MIAERQRLPSLLLLVLIADLGDTATAIDYLTNSVPDQECVELLLQPQIGAPLLREQPEKTLALIKRLMEANNRLDLGLFVPLFFDVVENPNQSQQAAEIQATKNETSSDEAATELSSTTRFSLDFSSRDPSLRSDKELEGRLIKLLLETLAQASKNPDSAPPVSLKMGMTALELLFRKQRNLRRQLGAFVFRVEGSQEKAILEKEISEIDQTVEMILKRHVKVS